MAFGSLGGLAARFVRHREAERPPTPRVLFIPATPDAGTSERAPAMFRMLGGRYPVAGLSAPWDPVLYDSTRARGPRWVLYVVDKALLVVRGLIAAIRFRANLVFSETVHHALAGLAVARVLGIRCAWDSHGNGPRQYESLGRSPWAIRLVGRLERFVGSRTDVLITVSETDASAYRRMGVPPPKIHVVPLCVRLDEIDRALTVRTPPPRGSGRPPILLFFGSFRYAPNREALEFLNDRLAPHLERRGIACEVRIAGRDIPEMDFHPFLRPMGFVPNIYENIAEADLCVVPVTKGVGVLTKIIDSMAVGTPLVLSDFAAQGIPEIRHRMHAYVARTESDFLDCVVEALSNPGDSRAMARRARHLVEQRFDYASYGELVDGLVTGRVVPAPGVGHEG